MHQGIGKDVPDVIVGEGVVDRAPVPAPGNDGSITQIAELMREGGNGKGQGRGQVADTPRRGEGQRLEDADACRVGERPEPRPRGRGAIFGQKMTGDVFGGPGDGGDAPPRSIGRQ